MIYHRHTYADLRLTVKDFGSGEQNVTSSTQKVTLVIGNTNYCNGENGSAEIEIPITVADLQAHATVFDRTATSFKVRIYVETDGGQTRPAIMNELKYRVVDTCADSNYNCPENKDTHAILAAGTMTYKGVQLQNGIQQAVYVVEQHANIGMHYRRYLFDAEGYDFGEYDIDNPMFADAE